MNGVGLLKRMMQNKKRIKGRGRSGLETISPEINDSKYFVDTKKLSKNILAVKYRSNSQNKMTPLTVSDDVKAVVEDVLKNTYNKRLYEKLSVTDKRIVSHFMSNFDFAEKPDEFKQLVLDWNILKDEYISGNDSNELKHKLKSLTLQLLDIGKINRTQGYNILYALSV